MRAASLLVVALAALGGLTVGLVAAPGAFRPAMESIKGLAGRKGEATATLSGTLRLQGRPVPYARVELHNGGTHVAHTGPDGSFVFENVPAGTAQVTIHTGEVPASAAEGDYVIAPESLIVPERYGASSTSGLRVTLQPGTQHQSFMLQY